MISRRRPQMGSRASCLRIFCTAAFLIVLGLLPPSSASAQELSPGKYCWYVPEHEKYGRTTLYSQPNFTSGTVRVTRTQRFKLIGVQKGWALIEFDYAGKAFVHLRILRNLMYDPAASDPWNEFQRASLFVEEPAKLEARLKGPGSSAPQVTDSKTPAWKRYKDGWNLKPGRSPQTTPETGDATATASTPSRPFPEKKPRSKHSMLPPIGSEPPPQEASDPDNPPSDPAAAPNR